jgi:hypothetical protein
MRIGLLGAIFIAASAHSADPVAGKFWYEQNCARCHGSPPQERQAGTPNITGFSADRIRFALANIPAMTKVNLSAAQIPDVEAYLQAPLQYLWAPGIDFSDLWWNPAEPGWGMTLTQRPNARTVGTLYVYDADRKGVWLLMTDAQWIDPLELRGTLLRATADGFPPSGFASASLDTRAVGTFSIRFADRQRGTLSFTVDGASYLKPVERTGF